MCTSGLQCILIEFIDAEREEKYVPDLLQSHDIPNLCIKLISGSK